MSDNEQNESTEESRSKPLQIEHPDSNCRAGLEHLSETNAVLSDIKTNTQAKEVAIDIENVNETKIDVTGNSFKNSENIDYLLYGYYGQHIRPPKTTWVMFQGGGGIPDGQTPLDYDPRSRNGFIRLTFSIVLAMLLVTAAVVVVVLSIDDLKETVRRNGIFLALPAMVVMVGLTYAMACCPCTRIFPCNIVLLVVSVICMTIICAWVTSRYQTIIVFYALIATCIVVLVCILLAFSGFDFTAWMLYIVMIAAAIGAVSLVILIGMLVTGTYMKTLHLIILIVAVVVNSIVLTMELQMILGGGAVELAEDDYALGAFMLYTSIVDIFIKLVQILGILDSM